MVTAKELFNKKIKPDSRECRYMILNYLKKNFTLNTQDEFRDRFIDSLIQAPLSNPRKCIVKFDFLQNKYDASKQCRGWIKQVPEMCGNYKEFVDQVNQIHNQNPFDILTNQNKIKRIFNHISAAMMVFAIVFMFIMSFLIANKKFAPIFWSTYTLVWQLISTLGKYLVMDYYFKKGENQFVERQEDIYLLQHFYNNNHFFEQGFKVSIGWSSAYFKLERASKDETVVEIVKKVTKNYSDDDPYAAESDESGGNYFIADSIESQENVRDIDIAQNCSSTAMMPWFLREILCGGRDNRKKVPQKEQYDIEGKQDKVKGNPKPVPKKKGSFKEEQVSNEVELSDVNQKKPNIENKAYKEDDIDEEYDISNDDVVVVGGGDCCL